MAVAPLNKFITKAVPVTPSEQVVYAAPQGANSIILYVAVANVGIGRTYPRVTFTHRRESTATRTAGNIRNIRLIKDVFVPPEDAIIIIDGRLVLERNANLKDSVVIRGYQSGVGTVYDAQYDHVTGLTTITTYDDHGLSVDDDIILDGLAFDCASTAGITSPIFPAPQTTFKVETVGTTTTFTTNTGTVVSLPHTFRPSLHRFVRSENNINIIAGGGSGTSVRAVKGTTYDSVTGILSVTTSTAHSMNANSTVSIQESSLVFKCSQDNFTDEKKYPRPTDPMGGDQVRDTIIIDTTKFTVNVGIQTGGGTVSPAQLELIMSVLETSTV